MLNALIRISNGDPMQVGIVIPVYNEGRHIRNVLSKIVHHFPECRIYAVDDGSTDNTPEQCAVEGVTCIRHGQNRGKGEALKSGFSAARADGAEYIITMDGDGQHSPDGIGDLIAAAASSDADLILGSRQFSAHSMPLDRVLSNRISSLLVSLLVRRRIPDSQCGFRMIRTAVLADLTLTTGHYEMETELLVKAVRAGAVPAFVPAPVIYRGTDHSSIRRVRDTLRFCLLWLRLAFST